MHGRPHPLVDFNTEEPRSLLMTSELTISSSTVTGTLAPTYVAPTSSPTQTYLPATSSPTKHSPSPLIALVALVLVFGLIGLVVYLSKIPFHVSSVIRLRLCLTKEEGNIC